MSNVMSLKMSVSYMFVVLLLIRLFNFKDYFKIGGYRCALVLT